MKKNGSRNHFFQKRAFLFRTLVFFHLPFPRPHSWSNTNQPLTNTNLTLDCPRTKFWPKKICISPIFSPSQFFLGLGLHFLGLGYLFRHDVFFFAHAISLSLTNTHLSPYQPHPKKINRALTKMIKLRWRKVFFLHTLLSESFFFHALIIIF